MTTSPDFAVEVDAQADPVVVRVRGELDMSTTPGLAEALTNAAPVASTIVVDLSAVSFLDSSALGTLVAAGRARNDGGGRLQVGPRSAVVDRVLEITGLSQTSEVFDVLPNDP